MSLQSVRDLWTQNFFERCGQPENPLKKNDNGKGSKRSKTGTSGCETKKSSLNLRVLDEGTVHTGQDRSGQLDFKRTDHWKKVGEKNK